MALLDDLAAKDASRDAVAEARATERSRLVYLRARTELELGEYESARTLFEQVLADERCARFHDDVRQLLAEIPSE